MKPFEAPVDVSTGAPRPRGPVGEYVMGLPPIEYFVLRIC
jgi:hypothetical protein